MSFRIMRLAHYLLIANQVASGIVGTILLKYVNSIVKCMSTLPCLVLVSIMQITVFSSSVRPAEWIAFVIGGIAIYVRVTLLKDTPY